MQSSSRAGNWDTWAWRKAGAGSRLGESRTGLAGSSCVRWHPMGCPGMASSRVALPYIRGEKQAGTDEVLEGRRD